ncbi:hypothetical protein BDF20DRAFT_830930 [Mycotypha africana]|uniref:uncharacterized protein n=1 Tax=Mycotypha africana TaxID=64632 RepID=UPI002300881C|nr:uncharacterized protein BDF20DRAFT_830930 [Mycotypha africana]KAI8990833.1 hypothetical protein BDF20DRAFT_830930 [Mycotypha africana]
MACTIMKEGLFYIVVSTGFWFMSRHSLYRQYVVGPVMRPFSSRNTVPETMLETVILRKEPIRLTFSNFVIPSIESEDKPWLCMARCLVDSKGKADDGMSECKENRRQSFHSKKKFPKGLNDLLQKIMMAELKELETQGILQAPICQIAYLYNGDVAMTTLLWKLLLVVYFPNRCL